MRQSRTLTDRIPAILFAVTTALAFAGHAAERADFTFGNHQPEFMHAVSPPASPVVAQSVTLSPGEMAQLKTAPAGRSLNLPSLSLGLSKGQRLEFKRIDLYDGGARVWIESGGQRSAMPRSKRLFFTAAGATGGAGFSLDPATGAVHGLLVESGHSFQLDGAMEKNGGVTIDLRSLREAREKAGFACGNDTTHQPQYRMADDAAINESLASGSLNAMHKGAGLLYQVVVAVDTDNEFLFNKFGNDSSAARNWIEDLFVAMNAFYEPDLATRLLLGDLILRVDSSPGGAPDFNADPEGFNDGLSEFRSYFNANQGGLSRNFAALLSGKNISSNSFSGVAYVGAYCSTFSYSFNRIGSASFISPAFIAGGVGHELGHNLGSWHTHCEALAAGGAYVDQCYANERAGCYEGPTSCPSGADGSLMSYCHAGASGFDGSGPGEGTSANCSVSDYFHPLIIGKLSGLLAANNPSCIANFAVSGQIFSNGYEN